jgi:hypothetical protein
MDYSLKLLLPGQFNIIGINLRQLQMHEQSKRSTTFPPQLKKVVLSRGHPSKRSSA